METNQNDYRISFFKPTTEIARHNRNIVVWLVCIWAVAIFGFQIALKLIEKPTPEPAYKTFEKVWGQVESGSATKADLQAFAGTSASVLGKNFIAADEKAALNNALTWALFQLTPAEEHASLLSDIISFESLRASISNIQDPAYVKAKNELNQRASQIIGFDSKDVRSTLVAAELTSQNYQDFLSVNKSMMPDIMSKYLIHNQSFLTDFKFLGFPFHYFYTSIFLLILFVALCLLYCIRIDRRNKILGIQD